MLAWWCTVVFKSVGAMWLKAVDEGSSIGVIGVRVEEQEDGSVVGQRCGRCTVWCVSP